MPPRGVFIRQMMISVLLPSQGPFALGASVCVSLLRVAFLVAAGEVVATSATCAPTLATVFVSAPTKKAARVEPWRREDTIFDWFRL